MELNFTEKLCSQSKFRIYVHVVNETLYKSGYQLDLNGGTEGY